MPQKNKIMKKGGKSSRGKNKTVKRGSKSMRRKNKTVKRGSKSMRRKNRTVKKGGMEPEPEPEPEPMPVTRQPRGRVSRARSPSGSPMGRPRQDTGRSLIDRIGMVNPQAFNFDARDPLFKQAETPDEKEEVLMERLKIARKKHQNEMDSLEKHMMEQRARYHKEQYEYIKDMLSSAGSSALDAVGTGVIGSTRKLGQTVAHGIGPAMGSVAGRLSTSHAPGTKESLFYKNLEQNLKKGVQDSPPWEKQLTISVDPSTFRPPGNF
jgi:hypothetical protein